MSGSLYNYSSRFSFVFFSFKKKMSPQVQRPLQTAVNSQWTGLSLYFVSLVFSRHSVAKSSLDQSSNSLCWYRVSILLSYHS